MPPSKRSEITLSIPKEKVQRRDLFAAGAMLGLASIYVMLGMPFRAFMPITSHASNMTSSNMTVEAEQRSKFFRNLPPGFVQPKDGTGRLLLREYGAVFLARGGAMPPRTVIFQDEAEVQQFQSSVTTAAEKFGSTRIELQAAAMKGLKEAVAEAKAERLSIAPRGADSGRRGYQQTVSLWASRVVPGMAHWVSEGKVKPTEAKRILSLPPFLQVPEILDLEQKKIFFAKDLSKTIIYSVAPPGTSQHLSMLALDVAQFDQPRVRQILAAHGWFQTVISDLPHFTFLGVTEQELPELGLKKMLSNGRVFWVPDIPS